MARTGIAARAPHLSLALGLAAAVLSLAPPAAAQGKGTAAGFRYEYDISPPELTAGGTALLVLKVERMSASSLRVDSLRLGPGLELETQAVRPYVMNGGAKGVELRLGFVLKEAGTRRIESLGLVSDEGELTLGPIAMKVGEPGGSPLRPALWVWDAPASAYLYQAVEVGLGRPDGAKAAKGMTASFKAPPGSIVESSGYLRWTVVPLEEGRLSLPDVALDPVRGSKERRGEAEALQIRVMALPAAIRASRAIGDFRAKLAGPEPARPAAGRAVEFSYRLEGKGNFPCLILPVPSVLLDGKSLGKGAWSSKRSDSAKPAGSGYSGSAVLRVTVQPPRPGVLKLSFPPLPVLGPDGKVRNLEVPAIEVEVAAPAAAAPAAASPAASEPVGATPIRAGAANSGPMEFPEASNAARLASLYGTMRRSLAFERAYREAAEAARAETAALALKPGRGEPLLDSLPPPKAFLAAAALFLAAAAAAFLAGLRRGRGGAGRLDGPRPEAASSRELPGRPIRRRLPAAAIVLTVLALAAAALGGAAALERRESFAVVWTDRLSVIPSPLAQLRIEAPLGSTARLRGQVSGYSNLEFADGVEAWVPTESVFPY